MHIYTSAKRRWMLPSIVLTIGMLCLLILAMPGSATVTYADSVPGGNVSDPVVRAVDIAEPAVVRILTTIGGHLTVHFSASQVVTFPLNSSIGYPLTLSGSGTFISAHGDILTADHVVNPPHDADLEQFLEQTAAQDVANYYDQNVKPGAPQSPDQITQDLMNGEFSPAAQYDTPSSEVYLSTDYTGPLKAPDLASIPPSIHAAVDRIEEQSPFNDKDVAIIHASNMDDTPGVQLDDSSTVQQQDELTIIGFPGNGDVSDTNPTDLLTSSVNKVLVSSLKTTNTGAPLIQVSGNVEHGDSGGPALDSSGNIVGIVSFGSPEPGSTSFLQASNSARGLIQSLHLNTAPGPFEQAWTTAFTDYAASTPGHWHKAAREFQTIAAHYSLFQAVTPYLNYAQAQAKNERLPQSQPSKPSSTATSSSFLNSILLYGWIIIAAIIILLLILVIVLVLRRGRRKKLSQASAAGQPAPGSPLATQQGSGVPLARQQAMFGPPSGDGMTAFGAPSIPSYPVPGMPQPMSPQPAQLQQNPNLSNSLRPWPCGHMNRPNARYCSICGEPAPPPPQQPTIRKYEQ